MPRWRHLTFPPAVWTEGWQGPRSWVVRVTKGCSRRLKEIRSPSWESVAFYVIYQGSSWCRPGEAKKEWPLAGRPRIDSRQGCFVSPALPDRHWGPPSFLSIGYHGVSPLKVKLTLSPTYSVEILNYWSFTSTPAIHTFPHLTSDTTYKTFRFFLYLWVVCVMSGM
jgi:hypothetical protein